MNTGYLHRGSLQKSVDDCGDWCMQVDAADKSIPRDSDLCCDYEMWEEGTFECSLYRGSVVVPNPYYGSDSQNLFRSMTFQSKEWLPKE